MLLTIERRRILETQASPNFQLLGVSASPMSPNKNVSLAAGHALKYSMQLCGTGPGDPSIENAPPRHAF